MRFSPKDVSGSTESGYEVKNAVLPDGTKADMHLFVKSDTKGMNSFEKQNLYQNDKLYWHYKTQISFFEMLKLSGKNAAVSKEGYVIQPYSLDEAGALGKTMLEKRLPIAWGYVRNRKELQKVALFFVDNWQTLRFSKMDFIDEETYQAQVAAQKAADEKAAKETANAIAFTISASQQAEKERAANQARVDAEYRQSIADAQSKVESQRAAQRQNNSSSNKSYLADRFSAFANDAMRKELARSNNISAGAAALIRSKYDDKGSKSVSDAELNRYEKLLEQGYSKENAARTVFNEFRM